MDDNINLLTATEELYAIASRLSAVHFTAARPAGKPETLAWQMFAGKASMVFIPPG
jgi:hypothetical protein